MNDSDKLRADDLGQVMYRRIYLLIRKNRWEWQAIGAALGLAGGMLSILLGTLLWVIVSFLAAGYLVSLLNAFEILFFVLTMPLLFLGAYCLDLLEKRKPLLPSPAGSRALDLDPRLRLRPQRPNNN
jgi:hypothetical protein